MAQTTPELQTLTAKKAEAQRPFHGQDVFDNHFMKGFFLNTAQKTLENFKMLASLGIPFSPFLEIGAGSVQRSSTLVNNFSAQGVATDISQASLLDAPYILSLLGYDQKPLTICCDSHTLPFLADSFQFVFAYQTLHHFENPIPILAECHRVLGKGGHLFFNEEPLDSSFRRILRGNRTLSHPMTPIQKIAQTLGVEKVFWDDGALERSLGMSEARFDLHLWQKALAPFDILSMEVNRKLKIRSNLYQPAPAAFLSGLIGGNIMGLCKKTSGEAVTREVGESLMCVDCGSGKLEQRTEDLLCKACGRSYPQTGGVIRMLPQAVEAELFPVAQ